MLVFLLVTLAPAVVYEKLWLSVTHNETTGSLKGINTSAHQLAALLATKYSCLLQTTDLTTLTVQPQLLDNDLHSQHPLHLHQSLYPAHEKSNRFT